MQVHCPYEKISYPIWRLRVLKRLSSQNHYPSTRLPFLGPQWTSTCKLRATTCRSTYTSAKLGDDARLPPIGGDKETASATSQSDSGRGSEIVVARGRTRRMRSRGWTPFSEQGHRDLDNLAEWLRQLVESEHQRAEQNAPASDVDDTSLSQATALGALPESPLLRRMRKDRPHKKRPDPEEDEELANNPWAQILASPVRYCQGSALRLPSDLLLAWGLMSSPNDGKVYLMPENIANTERLRGSPGAHESPKFTGERDTFGEGPAVSLVDSTASAGTTQPESDALSTRSEYRKPRSSGLYLLPLQTMLQKLSAGFASGRSVSRLYPPRWNMAISAASKSAEGRRGPGMAHPAAQAKWQPDIHVRLRRILETRVLAAFEGFARQTQTLNRSGWGASWLSLPSKPANSLMREESEVSTFQSEKIAGGVFLHIGSSDTFSCFLKDTQSSRNVKASIGPEQTLDFQWSDEPALDLPLLPPHPMIPPMLTINKTHRLPIFPVRAMLSPETTAALGPFLQDIQVLAPPPRTPEASADSTEETRPPESTFVAQRDDKTIDRLVFITPAYPAAQTLVKEIWRLWRYVGGRKVLQYAQSQQSQQDRPAEAHRLPAGDGNVHAGADIEAGTDDLTGATNDLDAKTKGEQHVLQSKSPASLLWQTGDLGQVRVMLDRRRRELDVVRRHGEGDSDDAGTSAFTPFTGSDTEVDPGSNSSPHPDPAAFVREAFDSDGHARGPVDDDEEKPVNEDKNVRGNKIERFVPFG